MERISRGRAQIFLFGFFVLMVVFCFRLYDLQIISPGGITDNVTTFTTYTTVKAARGDILDQNGNVLVSNRASYNLVMNHYVILTTDGTNEFLYKLVKCCQEHKISYTEHFPITSQRPFAYTLNDQTAAWQSNFQTYLNMIGVDSDISAPPPPLHRKC